MASMPLKVALFFAHPSAIPSMNMLIQQERLAGVVLAPMAESYLQQIERYLQQQGVPYARLGSSDENEITQHLLSWETDLIIAFGFTGDAPESFITAARLGYYHLLLVPPDAYSGVLPLYWLIRNGESHSQVVLQKVCTSELNGCIAMSHDYDIEKFDTYKLLENKVSDIASLCIKQFVDYVVEEHRLPPLNKVNGKPIAAPVPDENALSLDFSEQTAQQIVDMARAGNPVFNGCIFKVGQTPLSLLQATKVDVPTYGVTPGTICHTGGSEGVIVATTDGAVRMDVIANMDGIFSAPVFVERFQISAGMQLTGAKVI